MTITVTIVNNPRNDSKSNVFDMRFVTVTCTLFLSSFAFSSGAEKIISQDEYVSTWGAVAVRQMQNYKIPASITLAQGILESGNGNSELAKSANNHFGIKCHEWQGEKIYLDDDAKGECFRKYSNADESYKDHSLFLTGRTRYANLFTYELTDYKSWAKGLKEAGYATNPKYPDQLVEIIERLKLDRFDEGVAGGKTGSEMLAEEIKKDAQKETITATAYQRHAVKTHKNKINYIVARKGDTYYKIAQEFDMGMWQLYKYNDFGPKKDLLEEGDVVYLQPKRRHSKEKGATYVAPKNTTITQISQSEGIKIESLLELNQLSSADETVRKGQKILLR